ncbi:cytochrome c oxidase subunit 3 family protein [bacterium]|nr:cytochrome c oxidase subunit 3 family protein [bacterium]
MTDLTKPVVHHFKNYEHQHESTKLGMWVFLATELLFFGGLFLGYLVYRASYPEAFVEASNHLIVWLGTLNTFFLLTSSLCVAWAVHDVRTHRPRRAALLLVAVVVLALIFLGIKGYEWFLEYEEGLIPGINFTYSGPLARGVGLFFAQYFVMTGLHAIHMIIGIFVVAIMAWRSWRGHFTPTDFDPIELTALYWHFVDIVWIFLFPLLYLIGRT